MMNRLTRKDFRRAAEQLATQPDDKRWTKQEVIIEFIQFFEDTQRFAHACKQREPLR